MIVTKRSMDKGRLSSLARHVCDAVRLLNEENDILSVDWDVEYRYLWYETHRGESRHRSQEQKRESVEERAGTVARSWQLILIVFVMLVEVVRLKHDIIVTDFVLVKLLSTVQHWFMNRMLSLSTGSEFLRLRHVIFCSVTSCQFCFFFFDILQSAAKSYGCDTSSVHLCHVLLCHHCTCVHSCRALESQAKRCFHACHHIGLHTAQSPSQGTSPSLTQEYSCRSLICVISRSSAALTSVGGKSVDQGTLVISSEWPVVRWAIVFVDIELNSSLPRMWSTFLAICTNFAKFLRRQFLTNVRL